VNLIRQITSEERRRVLAPVRRYGPLDPVAADDVELVDVLTQLAGLGMAEPDPVAHAERVGGSSGKRCLHLARPLRGEQAKTLR
jgi:hypothetical protein